MIKVLSSNHCETPRTNIPCGFGNHTSSEVPFVITKITIGALATIFGDVTDNIRLRYYLYIAKIEKWVG
ncbi:hypothetical protein Hanom_Chr07g00620281 [Helianthus anomalus]